MATTPLLVGSTPVADTHQLAAPPDAVVAPTKVQPLWQLVLVGLGPMTGVALFGLLLAFVQRPT